jgi:ankyrin repeat protein
LALAQRLLATSREVAVLREEDGTTTLHWACLNGHLAVAKVLLSHGAPIDEPNKAGHTPLHWAAIGGHCKVLFHLVLAGADPLKTDSLGHNGLLHAAQYGNPLACYFFLHADRFFQGLELPPHIASHSSLATPVAYRDLEGHTALHWAAYRGSQPTVRFLLQEGAALADADNSGCTALHWAAIRNHADVAKFLVSEGAPLAAVDDQGKTAEAWAMDKGAKQIASALRTAALHPAYFGRGAQQQQISSTAWFAIGAGAAIGAGLLWITQMWYVSWFLIAATYFVARNRLRHMFPGPTSSKTPTFVGIFTGLYVVSCYTYWTRIVIDFQDESHPIPFWLHALFVAVNLVFIPLYYTLTFRNPGFIVKTEQNDIRAFVADVRASSAAGDADDGAASAFSQCQAPNKQFCVSCGVLRPLRAKHCRACDRCVVKMDHHCGWLNNCVGTENYRAFVVLLMAMMFIHLTFDWMCYQSVMRGHELFFYEWYDMWQEKPAISWLLLVHAFFGTWMIGLFSSHIHQICKGFTTNEAMNRSRYWYLRAGPDGDNPFSRGAWRNFREFATQTEPDWRKLYRLPAPEMLHML